MQPEYSGYNCSFCRLPFLIKHETERVVHHGAAKLRVVVLECPNGHRSEWRAMIAPVRSEMPLQAA